MPTKSNKPLSQKDFAKLRASLMRAGLKRPKSVRSYYGRYNVARSYAPRTYYPRRQMGGVPRGFYGMARRGLSYASRYGAAYYGGRAHSLQPSNITPGMARHLGNSGHETVIEYREYLGDIVSSSSANTFKIQAFSINPGMRQTFPWLSTIANNYEMYRLERAGFEFRTFSADALNSTNTALGAVVAAVDYDASSSAFTSRQEMENSAFAMSAKPSESFSIPVDCRASQSFSANKLYVRNSVPAGYYDIKTYDVGTMYIATTGFQGTSVNCGSLYVSYKVRLFKPVLNTPGEMTLTTIGYVPAGSLGTVSSTNFFGTGTGSNGLVSSFDTIGITQSGNVITFPAGTLATGTVLFYQYYCIGAATAGVVAPALPTPSANLTPKPELYGSTGTRQPGAAVNDNIVTVTGWIEYTGTGEAATLTFVTGASVLPGTVTACGINITQANGGL